jgi:hypothetical protein
MASADFSKRIPWPCGIGSLIARHVWRSPRVRRNPFPRLPPDLPMSHPSGYRASLSMARLPCEHRPCIRFLFVGSEFCLRLPPDLASRQRPCLQLTVPTTTACSGLAPYRITSCLAHHKKGRPSGQPFLESDFFRSARTGFAICSAGCVQQQADQPGSWFPAVEFGVNSFFSMQPGRGFRCPTDIMQRAVEPLQYEYRINRIRVYLQQRPGHWQNRFFPAQP